jgi:hypothetical protein
MAGSSFASKKTELDDACEFLRAFTLGKQGFTPQDGAAGIDRVNAQCEQMNNRFASGPDGNEVTQVIASAQKCILAAQTRLTLLRKNR